MIDTVEKYWDLILYAGSGGAAFVVEALLVAAGLGALPAGVIAFLVGGRTMLELIELFDWMKKVYAAGGTVEITVSFGASLEAAVRDGETKITSVRAISPEEAEKIQDGQHVARRCRVGSPSNPRSWVTC